MGFDADGEHLASVTPSGVGRTRREMAAQVQITQTFSQKGPQAVARRVAQSQAARRRQTALTGRAAQGRRLRVGAGRSVVG